MTRERALQDLLLEEDRHLLEVVLELLEFPLIEHVVEHVVLDLPEDLVELFLFDQYLWRL